MSGKVSPLALILALMLALGGLGVALWASGLWAAFEQAVFAAQRGFQASLAGGVRALRAGAPGAVAGLCWLGFLYGVLHAAGPGHGKVVLGSWAFGSGARLAKVAAITLAASLAQSLSAIVLVAGGAALFSLGRVELAALAEGPVVELGNLLLAALGLWLVARGALSLARGWRGGGASGGASDGASDGASGSPHAHCRTHAEGAGCGPAHTHGAEAHCGCGPAHAPAPEVAARASLAEAALLIAGVALRPCTGAVMVMLLTVLIGAPWAGVAAVLAMGLGTALVTLAIALSGASLGRRLQGAFPAARIAALSGALQLALGLLIVVLYLPRL